jgi:hypothetical protein
MGKTFKSNGYLPLHHSFGSLKKHQGLKKKNRHKRRMLANGHFNYCVSELDDDNVNMSTHYKKKVEMVVPRKPNKIGYTPNTDTTLDDVMYSLLPNFKNAEFTNMSQIEQLEFVYQCSILNEWSISSPLMKELIRMKRQVKRRNNIGYFKGHDKTKYYSDNLDDDIRY